MNPAIPPTPGLPLMHSSIQPLSSVYYEPGTLVDSGDKEANKSSMVFSLVEFIIWGEGKSWMSNYRVIQNLWLFQELGKEGVPEELS